MPELLEVHLYTKLLSKNVLNSKIKDINITTDYLHRIKGLKLLRTVIGKKIKDVFSKGKKTFIMIDDIVIRVNYGMTGKFVVSNDKDKKYQKISLLLNNDKFIHFTDYRKFSDWEVTNDEERINKMDEEIAVDPINYPHIFTEEYKKNLLKVIIDFYYSKINNKRSSVITFLRNQKLFPGVGNYMKSEIFYMAKICPLATLNELDEKDIKRLFNSYIKLTKNMSKYLNSDVKDFNETFNVYGRKEDDYGNKVIRVKTKDGRTTHYVQEIQNC